MHEFFFYVLNFPIKLDRKFLSYIIVKELKEPQEVIGMQRKGRSALLTKKGI